MRLHTCRRVEMALPISMLLCVTRIECLTDLCNFNNSGKRSACNGMCRHISVTAFPAIMPTRATLEEFITNEYKR